MNDPSQSPPSAKDIINTMLRRTADALFAEDFDALEACFRIPFVIETLDTKIVIDSQDKHRALFDRLIESYRLQGVTDIIRNCESAEFVSPDVICAIHVSHVMNGDQRIEAPTAAMTLTELCDDGWRITSAQFVSEKTTPIARATHIYASKNAVHDG